MTANQFASLSLFPLDVGVKRLQPPSEVAVRHVCSSMVGKAVIGLDLFRVQTIPVSKSFSLGY